MRGVAAVCTEARIRLCRALPRRTRWGLVASLGVLCWALLAGGFGTGGAVLGVLAAGGWGLGLLPIHADPGLTGPPRRSGEAVAPMQPVLQEQPVAVAQPLPPALPPSD